VISARKRFCLRGHDTWVVGRTASSGNCRQCHRERDRARWKQQQNAGRFVRSRGHTRLDFPYIEWEFEREFEGLDGVTRRFGDYYAIERDFGLLDYPHPNGTPLHGWPASGYGWPEDEFTPILLAHVLMQAVKDKRSGYYRPRISWTDEDRARAREKARELKARGVDFRRHDTTAGAVSHATASQGTGAVPATEEAS